MSPKKVLLAAALTGLIAGTTTQFSGIAHADDADKGECHGVNACKKMGDCGGKGNSCAGKNSCKKKGWVETSPELCKKIGGTFSAKAEKKM